MPHAASQQRSTRPGRPLGGWVKDHGLLLANIGLFLVFFGGMTVSGAAEYSEDQLGDAARLPWHRGIP
ncbi:hypothetical protein [Arthrobacter sp. UYEF36]|uniref:hypothetical protein n=1 Tax=Arthrobacter sp. UYEF36 TaxID=1756366 RepID=UPI00339B02B3